MQPLDTVSNGFLRPFTCSQIFMFFQRACVLFLLRGTTSREQKTWLEPLFTSISTQGYLRRGPMVSSIIVAFKMTHLGMAE